MGDGWGRGEGGGGYRVVLDSSKARTILVIVKDIIDESTLKFCFAGTAYSR